MTTLIENQEKGLKVMMNNQVTLIAKYEDEKGEYFYNENLDKQYLSDTPLQQKEKEVDENQEFTFEVDENQEFTFEVEYEHNGRVNGFALTTTTVKAKSYDKALEKIQKNFNNIYEISEA